MGQLTVVILPGAGMRARTLSVRRGTLVVATLTILAAALAGGAWAGWRSRELLGPRPRARATAPLVRREVPDPFDRAPSSGSRGLARPNAPLPPSLPSSPTGLKILLVGIDGATFKVLGPMAERGELPALRSMMDRGASGILRSSPPMRSPTLWTTIATGRDRRHHGIVGFLNGNGPGAQLVSTMDRRTPALWNVLDAHGLASGIVGWWVTWPAEPVRGWIVSDRVVRDRWTEWTGGATVVRRTSPDELMEEIRPLVVDPARPPMDEINDLVRLDDAEKAQFLAAERPKLGHGLSVFKFAHCAQRSYEEIAAHLLRTRPQPSLTAVFLGANDAISHTFWHTFEPDRFPWNPDRDRIERLGGLIPSYSRHNDAFLQRLLGLVDPGTIVFVISDHGFRASGELPEVRDDPVARGAGTAPAGLSENSVVVGQTGRHHVEGIFVASGGPVRAGIEVNARLHDIAPTVLALLGLPVSRELEGRVLMDLVPPEFWDRHPVQHVDSYDDLVAPPAPTDVGERADPLLVEQLRALGYVSEP